MQLNKNVFLITLCLLYSLSGFAVIDSVLLTPSPNTRCYDSCNGSAVVQVFSATSIGPFGVIWRGDNLPGLVSYDTVLLSDTVFNLCEGIYSLEVIDFSDFTAVGPIQFTMNNAPPIFVNYALIPPSCHDSVDGLVVAQVSGGTPNYSYQWSTSPTDTNDTLSGIGGGKYFLTVVDDSGCVYMDSVQLVAPDTLHANVIGTDVTCNGFCDGLVVAAPTGGTPGYHYLWNNSDTNNAVSNLCPGKFIVTVTDDNGCTAMDSAVISEVDSLKATFDVDSVVCSGNCDGQIVTTATGGRRPYSYFWSGHTTMDSTLGNLCAGTITATISDSSGCVYTENLTVSTPASIQLNDSVFSSNCGMCNGEIKLFPSGGTGPYAYLWLGQKAEDTISTIDSLCAGSYQVVVTDSLLCTDTFLIHLSDSSSLKDIGFNLSQPLCDNICDGAITAYPIGGVAPFTYLWSPGGGTDSTLTGLCAGNYTVNITDASGCVRIEQVTLNATNNLQTQMNVANVTCIGTCTGQASIQVSGGQAPYHIAWPGVATNSSSVTGLCEGKQPFVITDNAGCVLMDSAIIGAADTLKIQVVADSSNCYNTCTGKARVMITGGQAPYDINWSNAAFGDSVLGLCPGTYSVDVTDDAGCTKSASFIISSPPAIVSNGTVYKATCNLNNGGIALNPGGGTGSYTFQWANNTMGDSIFGIGTGIHHVTIKDSLGCIGTDSFLITNTNGPVLTVQKTAETCQGSCDGTILVTPVNANGPFTYAWLGSLHGITTNSVSGLCAGTYHVEVTVGSGCKTVQAISVQSGGNMQVSFTSQRPICNGSCDGYILSNVTGGLPPYQYAWSTSDTTSGLTNRCGGNYTLTVTDDKGCSITRTVELPGPDPINVALTTSNLNCYNVCDGQISSTVSGGQLPYFFSWSNGHSGATAANLCAGQYWVTVTDANGCTGTDTIAIGNGVPIVGSVTTINSGCGQCNGSITVNPSGGNGLPYSFNWSNGQTGNNISGLSAGLYTVTIFDNVGCSTDITVAINDSTGASLTDNVLPASCHGLCDGQAIAIASGGTAPYAYYWNDSLKQTDDTASSLCAGTYSYMVRDALGCISYDSAVVPEPQEISLQTIITPIACPMDTNGAIQAIASGGTGPIDYLWSTTDTLDFIDSLSQGTFWIQVTDSTGCSTSDTVTLSDPAGLGLSLTADATNCFGDCDGSLSASASGGTAPYTFAWQDPASQTGPIALGLCAGYTLVTVTDDGGCTFTDSALITSPTALSATPVLSNPTCNGGANGSIALTPVGGTAPFSYSWDNGMTGAMITGLSAGAYSVTIIDANQCLFQDSYILNQPAALTLNINATQPLCGQPSGILTALASGGTGSYAFTWNTIPTQYTSSIDTLWPGSYSVTVRDVNSGCTATRSVLLNNAGTVPLTHTVINEVCPNGCDGQATVHTDTNMFSFLWNDPMSQTDSVANMLCAGFYTVKVTDLVTGCISFDTVTIQSDTFETYISSMKGLTCYNDCDGSATAAASGGQPPYTFSWNTVPPQSGATVSDLCAGKYVVTASDSSTCTAEHSLVITQPDSIHLDLVKISDAFCADQCSGRARLQVSGGTPPYRIRWDGITGGNNNTALCPGSHMIEVTDSKGCTNTKGFTILNPTPIQGNELFTFPTCGLYDGAISLNPTGGKAPYFYKWTTGATTSSIDNLFAGIYGVTIRDINGCSRTFTFFLNNPNAPVLQFDGDFVDCYGDCNGIARVTPIGGVGPYTYLWNHVPPSVEDSLADLCTGIYFVKVTDATACIAFGADTIGEPALLEGNLTKITDGCGGFCEGEVTLNAIGGTTPYQYTWNTTPTQTGNTASELCAGFVSVVLSDTNNCQYTDSIEITPPPQLVIDSTIVSDASCFTNADGEATTYASGGIGTYDYLWSNTFTTQAIIGVPYGPYSVVVTDANGCTATDSIEILVTDTVLVEAFVDSFICIGDEVLLRAIGTGATIFNWYSDSLGTLLPIATGDSVYYTVQDTTQIVLRAQNSLIPPCFDLDTARVFGIAPPEIDAGPDVTIEKGKSVQLFATPPVLINGSFAWTPANSLTDTTSSSPSARPSKTTTYILTGTDQYGCISYDTVVVTVVESDKIYNGFSPNGDGTNDYWELPFLKDFPNAVVDVYNRWGIQVFHSEGLYEPWDGRFEGKELPAASYYFIIDYFGDGARVESGALTILY